MTKRTSRPRQARASRRETFYIKFFAPVIPESINLLMKVVDEKISEGAKKLGLLISTPGGNVFHGLSAYNYLKGCPLEVTTHNFGSADSIGVILFCAGSKRYSVPHARFLLHGVQANFPAKSAFEEKQLEERLKSLRLDIINISGVIAAATGKDPQEVFEDMLNRTTLNPKEAMEYGLVHEIKSELFPAGAELISIQHEPQPDDAGPNRADTDSFVIS
jgi:ATP-dependent protease ClpP protease subunit